MGDYSVAARQMTSCLEDDNLVVFVDRAGYGFSDDTDNEMTLEYIVEDYRKALKNANIEAPYILMPHSIGGAYANYWCVSRKDRIREICNKKLLLLISRSCIFVQAGEARRDIIYPYAEKMGNCEVVCLPGDHMIYEQKPEECGKLIKDFIDGLDE